MKEEMQKIFDHVWDHFITEGNNFGTSPRDEDGDGGCAYRTATGDRCALGLLIEDDEYIPDMEQASCPEDLFAWYKLPKTKKKWFPHRPWEATRGPGFLEFLTSLQSVHDWAAEDRCTEADEMRWGKGLKGKALMARSMKDLSVRFGLLCPDDKETCNG